jgi:uncharacterized protein (TIGR02679 family)
MDKSCSRSAEAAAYFRTRPELDRVLREMAGKFLSYGRPSGQVPLLSQGEERAIQDLRCTLRTSRGETVVELSDLDEALREKTKFQCSLREALESYLGESLESKKAVAARQAAEWEAFFAELEDVAKGLSTAESGWTIEWLESDASYLRSQWRTSRKGLRQDVQTVLRALANLPTRQETMDVPVLAQQVAGDAHALDGNLRTGRLLERALLFAHPEAGLTLPLRATDRDELLALAGLSVDEMSSTVLVSGLDGTSPYLRALRASGHANALTLRTVRAESQHARAFDQVVFVVENPSVFSALHRAQAEIPPTERATLICTSGQLSLAAIRLLEYLAQNGASVRYAGDFDTNGLRIAYGLRRRLGDALVWWRMSSENYQTARARSPAAGTFEAPQMEVASAFGDLVPAMLNGGSIHQEALIPEYIADVQHDRRPSGR